MTTHATKPLGRKAFGSTPHLIGSRMGPADHHAHAGQVAICTERARDRHDRIIVTEKLDGSCVAVANIEGIPVALGRAGYLARTSPHEQHHLFADWVADHWRRFAAPALAEGERVVGEWLAQAHGTRYLVTGAPFIPFAIFDRGNNRLPHDEARARFLQMDLPGAIVLHDGAPCSIELAMERVGPFGHHGAADPVEGAVWVVERRGGFDFTAKYVRPDKVDGCFLPEVSGQPAIWNWRP